MARDESTESDRWGGSESKRGVKHLGDKLAAFRKEQGWSQADEAEVLGIKQQDVSKFESDGEIPIKCLRILHDYGLDINSLADEGEPEGDSVSAALRLFENIRATGIVEVCPDRNEALNHIVAEFPRELQSIDVVGSSMRGLFAHRDAFEAICSQIREKDGPKGRFLIQAPEFSAIRAYAEGRFSTNIVTEIQEAVSILSDLRASAPGRVELKVALQTPTMFGIFLNSRRRALINPYPLTTEAFSTVTLLIRDTGKASSLYRLYYRQQFERAFLNRTRYPVAVDLDTWKAYQDGNGAKNKSELQSAFEHVDQALEHVKEFIAKQTPTPKVEQPR